MLKVIFSLILMITGMCNSYPKRAQQLNPINSCVGTYDSLYRGPVLLFVEVMPEYPGGEARQNEFFTRHFRYPARQVTLQTQVTISYFVTPEGKIIHPHIAGKSPKVYTLVDQEAIRVFKQMPRFKPGKCNGRNIAVKMTYRVSCMKLQD